ncbi:hypothetical protein PSZ80_17885 [Shigella sonnei]|uniref:Uncharacterized protein n=4 Tax=Escherichia coli TaxID=562 RepID=A0A7D6BGD0_ECOLX|nr:MULTISPECIES: hypothetical protein [Enterobacteriaceae]EHQ5434749.1 hypothetical protein [Escherichia coli O168]EHT2175834.1 hypothetical protein [Escherichia coli O116]EHW0745103.1 hypothetical protein [Escherichia coli O48]EHY1521677.1 hypothetical protein [Escherichia coli O157]EHY1577460.1 hypothetical protein [Escherichia coli O8]EHY1703132.1 hypothetical protein [Escherichia coli O21]EIA9673346.1 hypothetical protein [Escherichia coli O103]EIA9899127.1 hypothetical protein [Escheri
MKRNDKILHYEGLN